MGFRRPVPTPQSDALVVPMLKAAERALEALERVPRRRRRSPDNALDHLAAIIRFSKGFEKLMDRYEEIRSRPADYYHPGYDDSRAELKRRLDVILAHEDAKRAEEAKKAEPSSPAGPQQA